MGSYVIVKYCTYYPRWRAANTIGVELVVGYVGVGEYWSVNLVGLVNVDSMYSILV